MKVFSLNKKKNNNERWKFFRSGHYNCIFDVVDVDGKNRVLEWQKYVFKSAIETFDSNVYLIDELFPEHYS